MHSTFWTIAVEDRVEETKKMQKPS
ncbi:hypothetical protein BRAS3809_3110008 [Bradyrhizobium sp. STM 3809]|nr:hypothetical protein BRAS3809_3110008 [Bradyrhizobium sp. STM 3809]